MEKSNIIFVETHIVDKNIIINNVARKYGVQTAMGVVNKWFETYSAFVYDANNGELLFFKSRYMGTWENDPIIFQYR
jgi:hypothetical protein